jgi:hypothetical protein
MCTKWMPFQQLILGAGAATECIKQGMPAFTHSHSVPACISLPPERLGQSAFTSRPTHCSFTEHDKNVAARR